MMDDDSSTLPVPIGAGGNRALSPLDRLAAIPEEEIWLSKQKSARTRRAYRQDVAHFMRTLAITSPEELRQADHKAVIAWGRYMRETEHAAASTIRRRLAALSSLYKHLVRHGQAARPAGRRHDRRVARPRHSVGRLAGRVAAGRDRRAQGRRFAPEPRL
jgi:integrase/recombinase XerD